MLNFESYTNTNFFTIQNYIKNRYHFYNRYDDIAEVVDTLFNFCIINKLQNAKTIEKYFTNNLLFQIVKSSLIGGSSAILVKEKEDDIELVGYDGYFFSGILNDDRTLLKAFTIDKTDMSGNPTVVTFYNETYLQQIDTISNEVIIEKEYEELPIFLVSNNFNAFKPFGKSSITRNMMNGIKELQQLKEQEKNAMEIEANTRSVLLGVSNQLQSEVIEEAYDKVKDLLMITKDERNESPQFVQGKPSASTFSTAIENKKNEIKNKIIDENKLKINVNLTRQSIADGLRLLINYLWKVKTGDSSNKTAIVWNGGDLNTLQNIGDSIIKINQSAPDFFQANNIETMTGIPGNEPPNETEVLANELIKKQIEDGTLLTEATDGE